MSEQPLKPPEPPNIRRRFALYPYQIIGLPLLMLLPVLALFGIFGETSATVSNDEAALHLTIEYPTRVHYLAEHTLTAMITNASDEQIDEVTFGIGLDYLHGFNDISSSPNVDRITGAAYEMDLGSIAAGEQRGVQFNFTAAGYGQHIGAVTVSAGGREITRVTLDTFTFP